ncbi:hypothetical protein BKA61DRAFT_363358 [Leptodontidium sp. MPI-SDFR-AT-0119]|nr:hypothetical protein BKA61DRAFT_363358 [Leptodontidium sp. MPI-SDFR-AT-0119]
MSNCPLCRLLLSALENVNTIDSAEICILREGSAFKVRGGPRLLRICSNSGSSDTNYNDVQIGFPVLPEIASPIYFDLLRAWLRRCDESHECNGDGDGVEFERTLPSRLLYVGNSDPNILALHNTATQIEIERYVALSHCWGDLSKEVKEQFCSSTKNICSRQEGFSIEDLPRTFQDAIRVTRELSQQYLWIDSLCIL